MKSWLCAALAVLVAVVGREASAAITIQDGIPWVYSVGEFPVGAGYHPATGAAILHGPGRGNVTIPSDLDGYPVTDIGTRTFKGCSNLTSVTISDSVTRIWDFAFSGCIGLTSVAIPNNVTRIENDAFYGCSGLTNVAIGNGLTYIDSSSFRGCSGLQAFSVASDNPAYQAVSGLLLTKSGQTLLHGVNGDVVIPHSVTSIEGGAFSACSGLTSVAIPDSVTDIGDWVFSGCNELKTLYVPASWEGTTMLQNAGVPKGCTVIYGTSPEPSAEARYAAWLESLGKTAAELPMGVDSDGDGMSNWEECVAGTNPLDAEDRFEARIRKVDGKIVVDSSAENTGRVYRVHGTAGLLGDEGREPVWNDVTDEEDLSRTDCRYFKMEARFAD